MAINCFALAFELLWFFRGLRKNGGANVGEEMETSRNLS